jgi:tRNA 5-methylaminomethyl-2-thiouridine biosynthesis bifunctional protein
MWAMGSTYERGQNDTRVTPEAHARNAASLRAMLPQAHALLEQAQAHDMLQGWAQVRCASTDRLPLVGAVPARGPIKGSMRLAEVPRVPGLWSLCALGSRGLTLSLLAAELLVALIEGEPLPMEKDLADALDPARFALKRARKSLKPTPDPKPDAI